MAEPSVQRLGCTPAQTVGPFFSMALPWDDGPYVVPSGTAEGFWVRGQLFDGVGEPVSDGLIETWQADPDGRFDHPDDPRGAVRSSVPGFRGFSRVATGGDGSFAFLTLKPGVLPSPDGVAEAPHIDITVFARGLLNRVVTRLYFPDEAIANETDPVLSAIDGLRSRSKLVASPTADGGLQFDIHLQGPHETPFFDL
jgi:protocatechuate 3,4-dioxygenase alpha subunit